jgi:hypothetical protein
VARTLGSSGAEDRNGAGLDQDAEVHGTQRLWWILRWGVWGATADARGQVVVPVRVVRDGREGIGEDTGAAHPRCRDVQRCCRKVYIVLRVLQHEGKRPAALSIEDGNHGIFFEREKKKK